MSVVWYGPSLMLVFEVKRIHVESTLDHTSVLNPERISLVHYIFELKKIRITRSTARVRCMHAVVCKVFII